MATLTIRLPDEKHEKLRQLATRHKISINKLIEELPTIALTDFDTETRFRVRAALGSPQEAVRLLKLLGDEPAADRASGKGRKTRRRMP